MKISIIGAGNGATQLALAFRKAGHEILQVFNRSQGAGKELAKTVGAVFISDIKQLDAADVFLIAVRDDVIADIASQIKVNGVVAHTSGTKTLNLLKLSSANFGILYPLQTMTKNQKLDFSNVPILVDGNNSETKEQLIALAKSISKKVFEADEEQRQWIHVAAVFANNFTNHLYSLSEKILIEHDLSFEILKPLIAKTADNINHFSPSKIQTGPAKRGDKLVIEKHLQLLGDEERLKKVYEILTESIQTETLNSKP